MLQHLDFSKSVAIFKTRILNYSIEYKKEQTFLHARSLSGLFFKDLYSNTFSLKVQT